jgi:shikimate kinase
MPKRRGTLRQRKRMRMPWAGRRMSKDPAKEISAVLAEREPLYRAGSDMVLDTEGKTPEALAGEIYEQLIAQQHYCL